MRTSSATLLLALAACAPDSGGAVAADNDGLIYCALAGSSTFERGCAIELSGAGESRQLVIRHPDGGFRRFDAPGGAAVETADGVEEAEVTLEDEVIQVTVGNDRYRLPTAMMSNAER